MARPVCVVVGVGPGNGAAFARKFADEGYAVALLARNKTFLEQLESQLPAARAYVYDVTDTGQAPRVFERIRAEMGPVQVLVYNAGAGKFSNVDATTTVDFEQAWRTNALGCLVACQQVIPDMRNRGRQGSGYASIVIIGATASLKGAADFLPFASAKAAQRSLAQSLARHLGPDKIHVAYVIIDAVVDLERTRQALPDKPREFFIQSDDIAESVFLLTQQPQSAWTFEMDLRPFMEKW
jgi:NAD(P)-dependent dehydrogenase (short-subunit alcohol dehydrogenase family)